MKRMITINFHPPRKINNFHPNKFNAQKANLVFKYSHFLTYFGPMIKFIFSPSFCMGKLTNQIRGFHPNLLFVGNKQIIVKLFYFYEWIRWKARSS